MITGQEVLGKWYILEVQSQCLIEKSHDAENALINTVHSAPNMELSLNVVVELSMTKTEAKDKGYCENCAAYWNGTQHCWVFGDKINCQLPDDVAAR
jgi:hypothetical protein